MVQLPQTLEQQFAGKWTQQTAGGKRVMENGKETIAIRDWTYFSISLDHRIVDGAMGAEFMNEFIRYIQNPSLLILEG